MPQAISFANSIRGPRIAVNTTKKQPCAAADNTADKQRKAALAIIVKTVKEQCSDSVSARY